MMSAAGVLGAVMLVGAGSYYSIGAGRWSWFDCFYMTVITLSTVGFAETLEGMNEIPEARAVTLTLIILGSGTLLYFISSLTALIVEGDLQGILRRRSMERAIGALKQHVILCGIGTTGWHIATELRAVGVPFVVIDSDRDRLDELNAEFEDTLLYVLGDATDDHVLDVVMELVPLVERLHVRAPHPVALVAHATGEVSADEPAATGDQHAAHAGDSESLQGCIRNTT